MLSKEVIENALLECNGELVQASKLLNCKYSTLYHHVRKNNIKHNINRIIIPDEELLNVNELYNKFQSVRKVAKYMGVTKDSVQGFMRRHNIPTNKLIKSTVNHNFFKHETEESFYWAGFLAADGCVQKVKYKNLKNYVYKIRLQLANKDKKHTELFKQYINSSHKIYKNKNGTHIINILSKIMFDDLAKFNIVPRKTKIYTFPEWLIDHKLVNHFMRGYFDGDGCFCRTLPKNKKTITTSFGLCGTVEFLEVYEFILRQNLELNNNKKISFDRVGRLSYGGNIIVKKIANYLYKDSTIYLQRKYDKVYN